MDDPRRWRVLAVGFLAVLAACAFQYGLPFLVPRLLADGVPLSTAALLVACPVLGLLLTLLAWGAIADRWGERVVLGAGLATGGAVLVAAAALPTVPGPGALGAVLVLAGGATASVHAASGRLVLGWFSAAERGRAMAVRQTAQPLGVGVAALVLPGLAVRPALAVLGAGCLAAALLVVVGVRDPARTPRRPAEPRPASPYRGGVLWRVHGASALLVVPQFAVATFGVVFLVEDRGWSATGAGRLLALAQVGGAAARLAAGWWSDRVGSRLRPLRLLAGAVAAVSAVLAAGALAGSPVATAALLAAAVITVSTNGLAFTAVAEHAGLAWAGRALGAHNTAQNALAAATPPVLALVVGAAGYGTAFAATVAFPLVAGALVPVAAERRSGTRPTARSR